MSDDPSFDEFLRRIRAGDAAAAEELVRRYEPALRLEVKLRLGDPKLRRLLDPADVCQSVLGSFFVRAALGQFELDRPEQLMGLLATMARNKVAMQARRQRTLRRDNRRDRPAGLSDVEVAAADPSPSRVLAGREALDEFQRRLTDDERRLAGLRALGLSWADIAARLGGTPQALRKQFSRAVDRVASAMGLAEVGDE